MLTMLLAAAAAATTASPNAVVGRWQAESRHAIIEISRCGPSICGRVIDSDGLKANPGMKDAKNKDESLRSRPVKGMLMLQGFTWDDGAWNGGTVYNAEDGKTYKGKVSVADANHLKLRGCIFVPLCKTQTWTRVR